MTTDNAQKYNRFFVTSVLLLLVLTGALKLYTSVIANSTTSAISYMDEKDVVLWFLTNRQQMLVAGLLEIGIVVVVWRRFQLGPESVLLIAWLSFTFLAFRLSRWVLGASAPCGCLGFLGGPFAELLSKVILAWMLGGSLFFLTHRILGKTRPDKGVLNATGHPPSVVVQPPLHS